MSEKYHTVCGPNDIIKIDDGETFEGTIKQFEDCFFSNADGESIKRFCEGTGMKLEIIKAPVF